MERDANTYRLPSGHRAATVALAAGAVGVIASAAAYFADSPRFFHAYLTAYVFWVSIGLGSLFFTMLHYLVGAQWSITLRRLAEGVMITLPAMAVMFIPVALGLHDLYHWSHHDAVAADHLLQGKEPFLNVTFFIVRAVVYFTIWFVLAFVLYRASIAEDTGFDPARRARIRRLSAGGMILFAFTTTFAAFDWLMSLDAHWYSTIFGAYYFAGCVVGALCFITLTAICLRKQGLLGDVITIEHYNDLGKLTFAFMIFWAYMAFSQYFLIWYANIPEETIWFAHRWVGSWKIVSLALVLGHFVIPFILLMPKMVKRRLGFMAAISVWLLVAHWLDLFWLVLPSHSHHGAHFSWIDAATMLGIGGIFVGLFWRRLGGHALIPIGDPKLDDSLRSLSH